GDCHLADVVQQRTAVYVDQVGLGDIEGPCQPDGQVSNPLRMPFGLLVAKVERSDPSFQGVVVGRLQFQVCCLDVSEEGHVVNGNCCLSGERHQEVQPIRRGLERTSLKHLQHAFDLPLRYQGCRVVRSEPFFDEELCPR